ncbi:LIM/homeobox protein Lhx9 [Amphibalanus amphitrite]|uniref:LIM/homeobox protein Lhx9 n=1 Tax=Amphibalanus amphitrite TaxID=1232801 RepID=A0A6A4VGS3_AMPAM|nr:LIM/homeobox protein Lhx9 [Amphibalanus amphitrite]
MPSVEEETSDAAGRAVMEVTPAFDARTIPEFDGTGNVVEWLEQAALLCELRSVSLMAVLPTRLRGGAFAVWSRMPAATRHQLPSVKAKLLRAFAMDPFTAQAEMARRRLHPGETADVYLAALQQLAELMGGLPERAIAITFVNGLPEAAQAAVRDGLGDEFTLEYVLDRARARRRRAAASSDDDRLAAFARDLSDSWYSDLPPKLDAGGVSTSNANKKSTFIRLFSHRVKRTTPRGRPANSNERSEGHTPIDFYCFVAYVPLPPLSQHNGVPVLRCRIEKRLVQRTDGCGPRDEPPPHTELRRADVKVELAAACSVPSTASTGSPAICVPRLAVGGAETGPDAARPGLLRETATETAGAARHCAGCRGQIADRFYLLAVDQPWHSACLKCYECKLPLDGDLTCFTRDGNIYCKEDYYRLFSLKRCERCHGGISSNELVMRAKDYVYHIHCFTCITCNVPLSKGDQVGLGPLSKGDQVGLSPLSESEPVGLSPLSEGEPFGMRDGYIYCRHHYELLLTGEYAGAGPVPDFVQFSPTEQIPYIPPVAVGQKGRPRKRKSQHEDMSSLGMGPGLHGGAPEPTDRAPRALPDWLAHLQSIGDRRPAPANLPALCPELRARLAAEGIEQVFLVQYDADTPLCVQLLGGDTVARGGANWWRWGRAARPPWLIVVSTPGWLMDHITSAEGFSLPHLRYLVIDEADRVIEMAETGWLKAVERVAAATARRPASPAG